MNNFNNPQPSFYYTLIAPVMESRIIKDGPKLLYAVIAGFMINKGYCYAGDSKLAEIRNISERSINRQIKILKDAGYIRIEYLRDSGTGCIIQRHIYPVSNMSNSDYVDKNDEEGTDKNDEEININNKYINICANQDLHSTFNKKEFLERYSEHFYKHYPRKRNRHKSISEYINIFSAIHDEQEIKKLVKDIYRGLKNAVLSWQHEKTAPEFIPLASSWLNGRRWEDEYDHAYTHAPDELNEYVVVKENISWAN